MMTLNDAFYSLKNDLQPLYDEREAIAIAHELLNHITGLSKFERLLNKEQELTASQLDYYHEAKERLLKSEPLQYVIGEQWFMGRLFEVNEQVLIPRPETEELVQWIVHEWKDKETVNVLDIGTGSGCIPVSLKLQLPRASVTSVDISKGALDVAQWNAAKNDAEIELIEMNFLEENNWSLLSQYDVIVSNPPYIPETEKQNMHSNVLDYEPALALFVPDDDPLLFYKKLARFAKDHLQSNGALYCEVHKAHAQETKKLFDSYFTNVLLQKDMNDHERMVKATL